MTIQLTKVQLFLLMFIIQTGFVYTSFQNLIIEHGGRDASIQFVSVAILMFFLLLLFEKWHANFVINRFFQWIFLLYWSVYILSFLIYVTHILSTWVFSNTPNIVLIAMFLSVCFYASISRPETSVNLGVLLIPLLIIFLLFLFRAIPNLHGTNLLPFFYEPKSYWIKGFLYCFYAFGGIEIYLVLRQYLQSDVTIRTKDLVIYSAILSSFFLISILFTLMYFALDEIYIIPEPLFYILHSLEVTFIKRFDLIFIYIWLSWSLISIICYVLLIRLYWFRKSSNFKKLKLFVFFFIIGMATAFLTRYSILDFLKHNLIYGVVFFSFILPFIILTINKIRGKTFSSTSRFSS